MAAYSEGGVGPLFQYSLELTQQHMGGLVFPPVESAQARAAARSGNPAELCRRLHVLCFDICSEAQSRSAAASESASTLAEGNLGPNETSHYGECNHGGRVCLGVCLQRLTAEIIGKSKKKTKKAVGICN